MKLKLSWVHNLKEVNPIGSMSPKILEDPVTLVMTVITQHSHFILLTPSTHANFKKGLNKWNSYRET